MQRETRNGIGFASAALCLFLTFVFLLTFFVFPSSGYAVSYGKTTATGVRLRQQPSTNATYWFRIPIDTVCPYTGTVTNDGAVWYQVTAHDPDTGDGPFTGYIHADFFRPLSAEEAVIYEQGGTLNGGPGVNAEGATGMVTNGEVNLREQASTRSHSLMKLDRGTVVQLLTIPSDADLDPWYKVKYNNTVGYIQGPFIRIVSYGTLTTSTPGNQPVVTAPPAPTPVSPTVLRGYLETTKSGVNLRKEPAGEVLKQVGKGLKLAYYGDPVKVSGYLWYRVQVDGTDGYLRSDCVLVTADASGQTAAPPTVAPVPATLAPVPATNVPVVTQAPTVTEPPVSSGTLLTTKSGVNLRKTPAGDVIQQVGRNLSLNYYGAPVSEKGYLWYRVQVGNNYGYLRSDCVSVLSGNTATATPAPVVTNPPVVTANPSGGTAPTSGTIQITLQKVALRTAASPDAKVADRVDSGTTMLFTGVTTASGYTWYHVIYRNREYYVRSDCAKIVSGQAAVVTPTPAGTTPTSAPAAQTVLGYVRTIKGGVNVRTEPAGKNILGQVQRNVTYPYYEKTSAGGYLWYRVITAVGTGYLRSDCVIEADANGQDAPQPTANPGNTTVVSRDQVEASYATLKVGVTGTAVTNLVQELINQGYYRGAVTSEYTTAVAVAVRAFQTAKGLTADGVANERTQHELFGTTSVGTSDYTDLSMVIYPAEKIDWFTGGIQDLIPKGSNFKVYDVKTGIVWWAHRWSGGNHADIETLTAADTARLCRIYGVSRASQITSKTHWQRRPCLVTIGTRTFACALYGVPHNEDGDTIPGNNLTGQICLHFTNSRTHGTNKVVSYNEEAIEYAWQYAPNGHK